MQKRVKLDVRITVEKMNNRCFLRRPRKEPRQPLRRRPDRLWSGMDFDDYKYNNPINARCPTSHIQSGKRWTGSSNRHWLSRQTVPISSGVTGNSVAPARMSFSLTWGSWAPSAAPPFHSSFLSSFLWFFSSLPPLSSLLPSPYQQGKSFESL